VSLINLVYALEAKIWPQAAHTRTHNKCTYLYCTRSLSLIRFALHVIIASLGKSLFDLDIIIALLLLVAELLLIFHGFVCVGLLDNLLVVFSVLSLTLGLLFLSFLLLGVL